LKKRKGGSRGDLQELALKGFTHKIFSDPNVGKNQVLWHFSKTQPFPLQHEHFTGFKCLALKTAFSKFFATHPFSQLEQFT
jgi:hypothetical protein